LWSLLTILAWADAAAAMFWLVILLLLANLVNGGQLVSLSFSHLPFLICFNKNTQLVAAVILEALREEI
jgi:hypothetical protein